MPSETKKLIPKKSSAPMCGLCGKRTKLAKTSCCHQWICNDENSYVLFSYARNSCSRNHRRFTLCGAHDAEQHAGSWKTCKICPELFHPEMFDWYGSNEYNFEKLDALLPFTPIRCGSCGCMIFMSQEGYCAKPDGTYLCEACYE